MGLVYLAYFSLTYFPLESYPLESFILLQMVRFHFRIERYSIVCLYHTIFIQSSINGHLGCFCILTIVNYAVVDIEVHVTF